MDLIIRSLSCRTAFAFLLVFLLISEFPLYSQDIWYDVVSIPPAPNASSLGKYGEYPVDKSTGLPSINIPIYNIKYGGMEVPISLGYHASGIKVQEEESWVGMGWSLNAGGVITRVVKGRPDEELNGFLNFRDTVLTEEHIDSSMSTQNCNMKDLLHYISQNERDYEPDIFYYNFQNFSGSFCFNNEANTNDYGTSIIKRPDDDIKIFYFRTYGYINGLGFRITDTEGNIYSFEECEITQTDIKGTLPMYISTWYLTKISNPKTGKEIHFYYDSLAESEGRTRTWNLSQSFVYEEGLANYTLISDPNDLQTTTSAIYGEKYLSQIDFGDGSIVFYDSTSYQNHQELYQIFISNGNTSRTLELKYDMLTVNLTSRQRLNSLIESSEGKVYKYEFQYDNQTLPARTSFSIDHWGFYNGENNTGFIPYQTLGNQTVGNADRDPHWPYTKAGVLTKIRFPTGGFTEFDYENNEYSHTGNYTETIKSFPINVTGSGDDEVCITRYYDWFSEDSVYSDFKIVTTVSNQFACLVNSIPEYLAYSTPINKGPQYELMYLPPHYGKMDFRSVSNIYYNNLIIESGQTHTGLPGSLPLTTYAHKACASDYQTTTNSIFSYKVRLAGTTVYNDPVGGLRIKRITSYDALTGDTLTKTYDYNNSGYLTSGLPGYESDSWYSYGNHQQGIYTLHRKTLYSSPVTGLGASPNSVSYGKVSEFTGTGENNNGMIQTEFLGSTDSGGDQYYYYPSLSNQWYRTKVNKETVFRKNDVTSELEPVSETKYDYISTTLSSVTGLKVTQIASNDVTYILECAYDEYIYNNFSIFSYNFLPDKVTKTEHYPDYDSYIQTITEYDYTPEGSHFFPINVITYNSNGDTTEVKTLYPLDKPEKDDIDNLIINSHMKSLPEKRSFFVNNTFREAYIWSYDTLSSKIILDSARLVLPISTSGYDTINVMTYEEYDDYGNPTQVIGKDGIRTSFTWGYNYEYPTSKTIIAKVKDIYYTSFEESDGNSNEGDSYTGKYSRINGFSKTLSNLDSGIYILCYRKKISNNWEQIDTIFNITSGSDSLNLTGQIDDVRFYPKEAQMTTYTYNPFIGISSSTDQNGITTFYEYDSFGRLRYVRDHNKHILKYIDYSADEYIGVE